MENREFDYVLLREAIGKKYRTEAEFAKAMGIGRVALSQKLNNKLDFTRGQIINAMNLLGIPGSETERYFFTAKVHDSESVTTST